MYFRSILVFLLVISLGKCATFYVSNNGSDTYPGSIDLPFKTINYAKQVLRKYQGQANKVMIFPGTYSEEIVFTYLDSGQNGFFNTYEAVDMNNRPYIFGGKYIKGSSFEYDEKLKAYKTNVGAGTKTRQLFVNNRRATRAKSGLPMDSTVSDEGYQLPPGYDWSTWKNLEYMEFVEIINWVQLRCLVDSISSNGTITMQNPCWKHARGRAKMTQMGFPTLIENHLSFLDTPDEWYLDYTSGILYYIPLSTEPIEKSIFYLPISERLIYGDGNSTHTISHININGLIFLSSTWNGPSEDGKGFPEIQANVCSDGTSPIGIVEFQYGRNINILNSVFTQLGGMAILMGTGTQYCSIQNNYIHDISSVAIKVGDQVGNRPSTKDQTGNNLIYNNKIRYNSQDYNGGPGIMLGFCYNCTVSHNDLDFTPYTGISNSWGWASVISNFEGANTIANNLVNNTMLSLFDGGDFYTLGTQDVARSTCKGNVFVGSHNCYGSLYLDDGSRFWDVYENVVFGNVMTALIKGGMHNIHDNYWQNKGVIKQCGNHEDISYMHNTNFCAPCNPKCSDCGPITKNNNQEITDLSQAPKSILDNAGLVNSLELPRINPHDYILH